MRTFTTRRWAGGALTALAALVLSAGCGADGTDHGGDTGLPSPAPSATADPGMTTDPGAGPHNEADIAFAQGMIPHHQQALAMTDLAATRATAAEVKALTTAIREAQAPEITQMTQWLTSWGAPMASPGGHVDHSEHEGMPGMMSDEEMSELAGSDGAAFDRMFLEMMIRHHEGAVEMARTARQEGENPGVKTLAEAIESSQIAEIAQMRALLARD